MRPFRVRVIGGILAWVLLASVHAAAQTVTIDLDGLVLSISSSRTAQLFHIVDQLSEWDQFTHKQYGRWARKTALLDQASRDLLAQHVQLRKTRGWNSGLDQSFYVAESIDDAARRAVDAGLLTAAEAQTEAAVLRHFDRVLAPMLERASPAVAAFVERVGREADAVRPVISKLRRFADAKPSTAVTVYVVANPEEGSGGGRAT